MLMKSWLMSLGSRIRSTRRGPSRRSRLGRTIRHRAAATGSMPKQTERLEERLVLSSTQWVSLGPDYSINGQIQNIDLPGTNPIDEDKTENPVTGAVNVVLPHPSDPSLHSV